MAITIDWPNKVIYIPRNDLTIIQTVPTEIRALDLVDFHLQLRALEDSTQGMVWERTHFYVGPIDVGGFTLADVVSIVNNYTVTFEDGQYAVELQNANSNVAAVTNVNQVSVRSNNSAGLTTISGENIANKVWEQELEGNYQAQSLMRLMAAVIAGKTTISSIGPDEATVVFRDVTDSRDAATFDMNSSERTNRVDDV